MADARQLLGKPVARALIDSIKEHGDDFAHKSGRRPGLVVFTVDDPAARSYLRSLKRTAFDVGAVLEEQAIPPDASTEAILSLIKARNIDAKTDGILIQTPLPAEIDRDAVASATDPSKDVDGTTPTQAGLLFRGNRGAIPPSTARAVIEILNFYSYGLRGLEVVVLGRSNIVGKPVGMLALARHATVTWCHSRTQGLHSICKRAEILIAAAGKARMVNQSLRRRALPDCSGCRRLRPVT
ncbi:MAG: bifunctional 5,10-methylenetetrahydrofolate dehydrogenase/5,10-methenyltetrahydrofolate cyclohydrolase, partial [bacterium]